MLRPALASVAALALLPHPRPREEVLAVRDVTVIDVARGEALPGRTVVVRGERIESIALASAAEVPADARVIEGRGLWLVPGLVDAHVHYSSAPDVFGPLFVANGVVLVRDTGAETDEILALRAELARGERLGPELVCTGAIVDGDPPVWPFSEACGTPEEARAAVRRLHAAGVDQIKVYSRLARDVYAAAIEEAHAVGLRAIGHVPAGLSILDAVALGQDGVEHLSGFELLIAENAPPAPPAAYAGEMADFAHWFRYPEADLDALRAAFREVAGAGIVHCPTLVVMAGIAQAADASLRDEELLAYAPGHLRAFWGSESYAGFGRWTRVALPHMQALARELHAAGARLVTGTDLSNPYVYAGFSLHEEMRLLQEAGIPPADVLRAATLVPAEYLGRDERLGTLAPGKTASMSLVRANPLADVRNAAEIEGVFLRGRWLDRAALDALLADVRASVAGSGAPEAQGGDGAEALAAEAVLPGEPVASGRLSITFMGFDAGVEEFAITRTADGFAFRAESKPRNSPERPFVVEATFDAERAFRGGTYRERTKDPLEATYELDGDRLVARARRGGTEQAPETLRLADGAVVDLPVFSASFFTLAALDLAPGEERTLDSVGFGRPDWRPQASTVSVARSDDEELELAGRTLLARVHTAAYETDMGAMEVSTWTDEHGVVVRAELAFPMGSVEAVLAPEPRAEAR